VSLGDSLTWAEWVRLTAAENGVHGLTDDEIEYVLWERTAWPVAGIGYVRAQLVELFAALREEGTP
jgi:hypothetical protein